MPSRHLLRQLIIQETCIDPICHPKSRDTFCQPCCGTSNQLSEVKGLHTGIVGSFGAMSLRTGVSCKFGEVTSRSRLLLQQKSAFLKAQQDDVQEKLMLSRSECLTSHRQKGNSEDSSRRKLTSHEFPTYKFPNIAKIYVSLNQMVFPPCRLVRTASWWSIYEISSQPLKREVAFCVQHCPRALRTWVESLYLEGILYSSAEQTKPSDLVPMNVLYSCGCIVCIWYKEFKILCHGPRFKSLFTFSFTDISSEMFEASWTAGHGYCPALQQWCAGGSRKRHDCHAETSITAEEHRHRTLTSSSTRALCLLCLLYLGLSRTQNLYMYALIYVTDTHTDNPKHAEPQIFNLELLPPLSLFPFVRLRCLQGHNVNGLSSYLQLH